MGNVDRGASIFISETIRREAAHAALVAAEQLPVLARDAIADLRAHLTYLDARIDHYERQLVALARQCEPARRIQTLTGIGPLTASAITASVASGHEFANGRQFAAWLGLVPRQYSTGGKTKLGRITKRGDAPLRTLLMLGARAVLQSAAHKSDRLARWAMAVRAAARLSPGDHRHRGQERAHRVGVASEQSQLYRDALIRTAAVHRSPWRFPRLRAS